jgi:hypothetical protein
MVKMKGKMRLVKTKAWTGCPISMPWYIPAMPMLRRVASNKSRVKEIAAK